MSTPIARYGRQQNIVGINPIQTRIIVYVWDSVLVVCVEMIYFRSVFFFHFEQIIKKRIETFHPFIIHLYMCLFIVLCNQH